MPDSSDTTAAKAKEAEKSLAAQKKTAEEEQHGTAATTTMTMVELNQDLLEPHDSSDPVLCFAVEKHQRNTADNPDRESTNILPVLVRRVDSEELLPRPFKTTCQLLCVSYLSALCCLVCGAYAVNHAWEAKEKRNAGVFTSAVSEAKRSCCCLKVALVAGLCLWLIGVVLVVTYFTSEF